MWIYSENIGMSFRLEMCGWIVVKRGKLVKIDGWGGTTNRHIANIHTTYKYHVFHSHMGIMRKRQGKQ